MMSPQSSPSLWPLLWQHIGVTLVIACAFAWVWRRWRLATPSCVPSTHGTGRRSSNLMKHASWPLLIIVPMSALLSCLPIASLTITAWLTPLLGQLSLLSVLLMIRLLWRLLQPSTQAVRPLLPTLAWGWIALLGGLLWVDLLAFWPWDLYASGYWGQHAWLSPLRQSLPLLWWIGFLLLARPALWLVLPWVVITLGVAPNPNVWDAWIDLPLLITALIVVTKSLWAWRPTVRKLPPLPDRAKHLAPMR